MSEHDVPDETPADALETLDGRAVLALAELDHRGRRAAAALRTAASDHVAAARAVSNGTRAPAGNDAVDLAGSAGSRAEKPGPVAVDPVPGAPLAAARRRRRRPRWLAAAAVVVVAVAGAVLATRSDGREPVAMSEADTAYLVPGWLPEGWQARRPVLPQPFNMVASVEAVYGDGDAEDPWAGPLLHVTHFTNDDGEGVSREGEPITIGGREGVLFAAEPGRWVATNGELAVSGERGATRDQVVAAAGHATEHPAIAPAGLPDGYEELARGGGDATTGTLDGVETGVVVSYTGQAEDDLGPPTIEVLQRAGDADAVDLARLYTESARATTVRGQHAVINVHAEGVQLQWLEPPGVLVTVDALRVSEEEARRFAEELRPAQPDEVNRLIADFGVEDGAPAWDYERADPPLGDPSAGETGPATPEQDRLRTECSDGSMSACDRLWQTTPVGSDLEAYAETCGGRDPDGGHRATCAQDFGAGSGDAPSDDASARADGPAGQGGPTAMRPEIDTYRAECAAGSMAACDQLWAITPVGSEPEAFAETCGGRDPAGGHEGTCETDLGPNA